ncbi:MAG: hypothetical protein GY841_20690, partial [FCB group bacterium]|nr:hypothetical protein [FCB group bacterium]
MTNPVITNIDNGSVGRSHLINSFELLTYGGVDTIAAGTLLGRVLVDAAITPAADAGNTGNGTCTVASVTGVGTIPIPGSYNLECVSAVTNGGVFKLEDPQGRLLTSQLTMTAGAGAATIFETSGLIFTLTDGSTDFASGDIFLLPVVANNKMVPFATDGVRGAEIPVAVMSDSQTSTGAGDLPISPYISGTVTEERLIIDAVGTPGSGITAA